MHRDRTVRGSRSALLERVALGVLDSLGEAAASAHGCPRCGRDRPMAIAYGNYSLALAAEEARGAVMYGGRIPRSLNRACRACGHMWRWSAADSTRNGMDMEG